MATAITHVMPGSIAARIGLQAGDILLSIAGEEIIDQIDYQALTALSSFDLTARRGEKQFSLHVRKEDWEPLGLTLDQTIVSSPRPCANHCIFCFIDQMPPNMRPTLYVKDDDWRLSLMMGNYITMTNISEAEFDRILRRRVSPLFISVHATDPELRCRMLRNRNAGRLMERLERLRRHGLRFHCQVVLCPGWNDGEQLMRTLRDLSGLYPVAQSCALVPVGLTKYRDGLDVIRPYTRESAAELIRMAEGMQEGFLQRLGTRFVFPADEFYCLAEMPLPTDEEYEDYPQLENGVGMLRMFETELYQAAEDDPVERTGHRRLIIPCGTSVAPFMRRWCSDLAPEGTQIQVIPILNRFFGESVTVTGLITGGDLADQLKDVQADRILIARNMLRAEGDLFLDDVSLDWLRKETGLPIQVVEQSGEALWRAISGLDQSEEAT